MPVSGLVVTLTEDLGFQQEIMDAIVAEPRLEMGYLRGQRMAVVMDTRSAEEDKELWSWLTGLPGVLFVDVTLIGFEGDDEDESQEGESSELAQGMPQASLGESSPDAMPTAPSLHLGWEQDRSDAQPSDPMSNSDGDAADASTVLATAASSGAPLDDDSQTNADSKASFDSSLNSTEASGGNPSDCDSSGADIVVEDPQGVVPSEAVSVPFPTHKPTRSQE